MQSYCTNLRVSGDEAFETEQGHIYKSKCRQPAGDRATVWRQSVGSPSSTG